MNTRTSLLALLSFCGIALFASRGIAADPATPVPGAEVEKIVCIRHGEKPPKDLGQLSCQGLNRALALPDVLISHYGKADFVFAPLTSLRTKKKASKSFCYIRPLMTIEPTAIRLGLPVDSRFAYDDIETVKNELTAPTYQHAIVFLAWEHTKLVEMLQSLVKSLGADPSMIPQWNEDDFDSIDIITIRTENGKRTVTFQQEHEGLNGLKTDCETAAAK